MVEAVFQGHVIARSGDTVFIQGNHWTHRHPSPLAPSIKNHIEFRGGLTVRESQVG